MKTKLLNKKLKQDKVVLKLLVVLKEIVAEADAEAILLKDVVCKALIEGDLWEDVVLEALVVEVAVHKLLFKGLLFQALRLEVLSQASCAKLKLVKVEAVFEVLLLHALLSEGLSQVLSSSLSRPKLRNAMLCSKLFVAKLLPLEQNLC